MMERDQEIERQNEEKKGGEEFVPGVDEFLLVFLAGLIIGSLFF